MCELYQIMSRIIYDRAEVQKTGDYLLKRTDMKNGFNLEILRNNKKIISVDYSEKGGVISNISATQEEIDVVMDELNSCLSHKSYLKDS